MRVVIDTNVIVSGDLSPHGPRIVNALLSEAIQKPSLCCATNRILSEYAKFCCGQPSVFRAQMWKCCLTS